MEKKGLMMMNMKKKKRKAKRKNYSAALFSLNLMRNRGMMKQSRVSESEGMAQKPFSN